VSGKNLLQLILYSRLFFSWTIPQSFDLPAGFIEILEKNYIRHMISNYYDRVITEESSTGHDAVIMIE
jgi:hypothetical protein